MGIPAPNLNLPLWVILLNQGHRAILQQDPDRGMISGVQADSDREILFKEKTTNGIFVLVCTAAVLVEEKQSQHAEQIVLSKEEAQRPNSGRSSLANGPFWGDQSTKRPTINMQID